MGDTGIGGVGQQRIASILHGYQKLGVAFHALHHCVDEFTETLVVQSIAPQLLQQDTFKKEAKCLAATLRVFGRERTHAKRNQLLELGVGAPGVKRRIRSWRTSGAWSCFCSGGPCSGISRLRRRAQLC